MKSVRLTRHFIETKSLTTDFQGKTQCVILFTRLSQEGSYQVFAYPNLSSVTIAIFYIFWSRSKIRLLNKYLHQFSDNTPAS